MKPTEEAAALVNYWHQTFRSPRIPDHALGELTRRIAEKLQVTSDAARFAGKYMEKAENERLQRIINLVMEHDSNLIDHLERATLSSTKSHPESA